MTESSPTYEQIEESANFIKEATNTTAKIAVIASSSLGVPKCCQNGEEITCTKIPHVGACADDDCSPCPNVLHAATVGHTPVLALAGRPHVVHENTMKKTAQIIKSFKILGVETVILVAPAGALNPSYKVGDIMIIKDHINFMGLAGYNPLIGKNDKKFGPRYLSMNSAYGEELKHVLNQTLTDVGYSGSIHEGVYVAITGPVYPTQAEKEFLHGSHGDAIGMYLMPEILLTKYSGMNILAMCLITEEADIGKADSNYDNVHIVGDEKLDELNHAIEKLIQHLDNREPTPEPPGEEVPPEEIPPDEAHSHQEGKGTKDGPCCKCSRKKKE